MKHPTGKDIQQINKAAIWTLRSTLGTTGTQRRRAAAARTGMAPCF